MEQLYFALNRIKKQHVVLNHVNDKTDRKI